MLVLCVYPTDFVFLITQGISELLFYSLEASMCVPTIALLLSNISAMSCLNQVNIHHAYWNVFIFMSLDLYNVEDGFLKI